MAFGTYPNPIAPANAVGREFTPTLQNYLDTYDFTTADMPQLREMAFEKYNNTISGFVSKYATSETLTGQKYIWSELESKAVTYEDATLTVASSGASIVLTRAASANVHYRKWEKIQIQTSAGSGVFIVSAETSETSVTLLTYDAASITLVALGDTAYTSSITWSLGIEVPIGSEGADFTKGITRNYSLFDNAPAITREVYANVGSTVLEKKWVEIDGNVYWYVSEIDDTRERFFESIEKKHVEGTKAAAASGAYGTLGLRGTQGLFDAISDRGANWGGNVTTVAELEDIIKYLDKVQGAGINLFMTNRQQGLDFDTLGRTFNASYGGSATLSNYIGEYMNDAEKKVLNLGYSGFKHGDYIFTKQVWKYLNDHTFRGNDGTNADADIRVNFLMIPIGMTPTSDGDQNLAYNPVLTPRTYLSKFSAPNREYNYQVEGGFGTIAGANNTSDDRFKVNFLNESMLVAYNAEKFIIGKGA